MVAVVCDFPDTLGHGAYFADNPQKSHGYARPDINDGTHAMFYAKVLSGIPSVLNHDNPKLTSAPIGFHSVQGTGGQYPGRDKNGKMILKCLQIVIKIMG
ncbi:unnamed protein product [Rotaria sp. Silwood1]|nr:unnamed protein product [Rotaria sp. Silwood1]